MRKLLYILLLFPFLVSGQVVINLSPDSTLWDLHILPPSASFDSSTLDRYLATQTFRLGSTGVTIAEVDTSAVAAKTDTIRFYITGSDQPTPLTTVLNASLDTSLQIGSSGVVWDSIVLVGGEIWWYSGGAGKNISEVIYTTPSPPDSLIISSPASDTLTYEVKHFPIETNGTTPDSNMVRWDTVAIPTLVTDGNLVYLGDTNVAETDFFIDMADSLKVYVSTWSKNDGALGTGTWSAVRTDSVWIDSTGEGAVSYLSEFYSDTILVRWGNDPTPGSDYDLGMDSTFYELDTAGILRTRDLIYFTLSHDSADAKINLAIQGGTTGNFPLTYGVAGLTWTDSSWVGNGSAWFTTGWNPTDDAIHFAQNDASIAVTTNQDDARGAVCEFGVNNGDNDIYMCAQYDPGADQTLIKLNGSSTTTFNQSSGNIHFVGNRAAGTGNLDLWIDGVEVAQGGAGTDGITNIDCYVFARNSEGTADWFSSNEIFHILVGDELTPVQTVSLNVIRLNHERRSKYSK